MSHIRRSVFLGVALISIPIRFCFAEAFVYDSHGKRDPFVTHEEWGWNSNSMAIGDLRLEGIIQDEGGGYAILNSEIVQTGEEINGFRVEKIGQNSVVLKQDEKVYELILRSDESQIEKSAYGPIKTERAERGGPPTESEAETTSDENPERR